MADVSERLSEELEGLRKLRDELRVRIHLGRAEAKERWEQLEKDWQHLEAKFKVIREESREDLAEIREAARMLVSEIRAGYRHVRDLL